jgi:hypothetical protein
MVFLRQVSQYIEITHVRKLLFWKAALEVYAFNDIGDEARTNLVCAVFQSAFQLLLKLSYGGIYCWPGVVSRQITR